MHDDLKPFQSDNCLKKVLLIADGTERVPPARIFG